MLYFSEDLLKSLPYGLFVADGGHLHSHKFWEIAIFLNGKSFNYNQNGEKTKCSPLYCMIFRPIKDCHYIEHEVPDEIAHIDIYASKNKMQNICNMIKTEDDTPFMDILIQSEQVPQFFLSQETVSFIQNSLYTHDFRSKSTEMDNIHSSIIFLILSEYYSHLKQTKHQQPDIINQIFSLLKNPNNFTESLDDILKQLPFSRTYINQEFKKRTNSTLVSYFDRQKIFHASMLLLNTDKTILSIANTVGFATPKNFIAQFKKVFNCNPSDYRRKLLLSE